MTARILLLTLIISATFGCSEAPGPKSKTPPAANSTTVDDAPLETWTWVEVPDTACGDGSPAGIGVNLTDASDDLFVYFMGGGACWDVTSCFVLSAAVNIETGYDRSDFEADATLRVDAFDRSNERNPIRDMSWVYVPYCTGDLHAGASVTTYTSVGDPRDVHHVGGANVRQFLNVLSSQRPRRVFVAGSSAGGYGAQLNAHRFVTAFPSAEVHVLADSAPMIQPYGGRIGDWDRAWGFPTPPGCDDCATSFPVWFDHLLATYPSSRFGLLAYDADQTIHLYFGYPLDNAFQTAMNNLLTTQIAPATNAHAFVLPGTQHVMLHTLLQLQHPRGTSLVDWFSAWISGSNWSDALPD